MVNENLIIKDWKKIDISVGLIYPNVYEIGMSSYTIRLLYYLLNSRNDVACERFFLPQYVKYPASKDLIDKNDFRSIENKILPEEFDILGFSIQFENDFRNVMWILDKAGINLTHNERTRKREGEEAEYPLIIGGGPVITSNPLPFSNFFDIFFIGDAEPTLSPFFDLFHQYKYDGLSFDQFLRKISLIKGLYIPKYTENPQRAILHNLDDSPIPNVQLMKQNLEQNKIFESNFFIEINRGCPFQCKFCISSFHNSPFRNRSYENIVTSIDNGILFSKFETISFIGSCVSAHPKFQDILKYIINKGKNFTIPSMRIEHITPEIIELLEKANIKTITIAPETGFEKLRREIGKNISNETIISVLQLIRDSELENIKFYFLIGLPGETESDIEGIISLLKVADGLGFHKNALRVNINPFVPKFNIPFNNKIEFYSEKNISELKSRYKKLQQELKKIPSVKLNFLKYDLIIKNARLQALIALGDKDISNFLMKYYYNGANFGGLRTAEKQSELNVNEYFKKIQFGYCPWNIL